VKSATGPSRTHGGGQSTKKHTYEDPLIGASKIWKRKYGVGRGRGRGGSQGGRGRLSQNCYRFDFSGIANALNSEERKRHIEEGIYFKCHKKGHRLFQCPELRDKAAVGAPSKKQ
jgi:hypothetical protein